MIMAPLLNHMQAFLKHPTLWRFVGFASAVVGLLCYGLSSSFNSLFGKWKLWKTFLYFVFSFIMCAAVLFAKVWQHSSSLRLKAHMTFFVLTITTFYSFFFDKAVTKKPDSYSVVSCAAFAMMWLSLSRRIHCGFEVDLLHFFLGALIVQLMKINWLLGIVGAGLSYSLIILRSSLDALPEEANEYPGLEDQPQVLIQVSSLQSQSNASSVSAPVITQQEANTQDKADINLFKPQLLAAIKALDEKNLLLIDLLMRIVGKFLQPDNNLFIDTLPSEIINNINKVMMLAAEAGFEEECCHLYSSSRKEFFRQCLSTLSLQIFIDNKCENIGMTEERVQSWTRAFEVVVRIVVPNEQRLCDRIFSGLPSIRDLSFLQILKEPTIRLLNFPETFAVEINWPMIREAVQVWNILSGFILMFESFFPHQDAVVTGNEVNMTCKRLGEAIRDVFKDMDNLIRCDTRAADVPGGIYPIAHDVVNCLCGVTNVRPIIERVWEEYPMASSKWGTSPSFLDHVAWILWLLDNHLEARSKSYAEHALCYVSMMNNAMYVNEGRRKSFYRNNLNLRHNWIKMHPSRVLQNLKDYLSSWNDLLGLLRINKEEESVASGVAAESMKEKLELFNIQFEKICRIQSKWFASDSMRPAIIDALENMLLPTYGKFIGRIQDVLGKHADECIQFGISDIKAQLNNTFLGGRREIDN